MSALGTGTFHDAVRLPSLGESGTDAAGAGMVLVETSVAPE